MAIDAFLACLFICSVTVQFSSACPDLPRTECVLVRVFLHKFLLGNFSFLSNQDPEYKHGVLGGTRLKQRKWKKYNENGQNDAGAPWRMNFKLNECQHSNCFKTKVQLNKCEIHMNVTFTFHSHQRTPLSYSALFFWVTGQFSDKPTRSQDED